MHVLLVILDVVWRLTLIVVLGLVAVIVAGLAVVMFTDSDSCPCHACQQHRHDSPR